VVKSARTLARRVAFDGRSRTKTSFTAALPSVTRSVDVEVNATRVPSAEICGRIPPVLPAASRPFLAEATTNAPVAMSRRYASLLVPLPSLAS